MYFWYVSLYFLKYSILIIVKLIIWIIVKVPTTINRFICEFKQMDIEWHRGEYIQKVNIGSYLQTS